MQAAPEESKDNSKDSLAQSLAGLNVRDLKKAPHHPSRLSGARATPTRVSRRLARRGSPVSPPWHDSRLDSRPPASHCDSALPSTAYSLQDQLYDLMGVRRRTSRPKDGDGACGALCDARVRR